MPIFLISANKMGNKIFTLTKRIAKPGSQAIITIPRLIEDSLKPGTIDEVKIEVLTVVP